MARKKKESEKADITYMLTYGNLITLLVAFFAVMLSQASFDAGKIYLVLSSFDRAFGGIMELGPSAAKEGKLMRMGMEVEELSIRGIPSATLGREAERGLRDRFLGNKISQALVEERKKGAIRVRHEERGIIVQLTDKALFDSGKADIKLSFRPILDKVAGLIATLPNQIRIEGHTDNIPARGLVFSSNWELSVARATNVLRFFEEIHHIPAERLSAVGYGEYRPIDSNDSPEGRAANRRVDVLIIREEAREEPKGKGEG